MAKYNLTGSVAPAATTSALNVTGGTGLRMRIERFTLWTTGVPSSDAGVRVAGRRSTTAGTGTSVTPTPLDEREAAAEATALSALSAEPTYSTASGNDWIDISFNPRNSKEFQAWDQEARIVSPPTASNGLGFQITTAGGALTLVGVSLHYQE